MTDDDKIATIEARLAEVEGKLENARHQLIALRTLARSLVNTLESAVPPARSIVGMNMHLAAEGADDPRTALALRNLSLEATAKITDDPDAVPLGRGR